MLPTIWKGACRCEATIRVTTRCLVTSRRKPACEPDHPLRPIRRMTDAALERLSPRFDRLYSTTGRPSIPPEKLLRALLLQMLYSIRSERLLMEELDYNILYRWFVGLSLDDAVWDATTFTKNRDRLLDGRRRRRVLRRSAGRRSRPTACCRTSISPSMARCSKRGRATKASNRRAAPAARPTIPRIPP